MAWNEPGGNNRDPWGNNGKNQGPPDLDEVVKKLQDKMGGLFGGKGRRDDSGGGAGKSGGGAAGISIIILGILVVVLAVQSFYIIQPPERGVVKTFGGYEKITDPGPHLLIPFIQTVDVVNVDQINKFAHRAQMLTRDENIVDLSLTVQFRIQDAADFLFQDADPEATIKGAMESSLREVVGKSTLDDIITEKRLEIADSVKLNTQKLIDLYRTGLVVTNVNIQDANPPEAVQEAFDDATKAREDKERAQNQAYTYANDIVPRARGNAARQIEEARAYKAQVVAQAEGESHRFLALLKEYQAAPEVTRERLYLNTVENVLKDSNKVMLDVKEGGNNLTYLPLDKIVQPAMDGMSSTKKPTYQPDTRTSESPGVTRGGRDDRARRTR
ncbi:MAG: FtsH protease activity modulator HflK [bacterium]